MEKRRLIITYCVTFLVIGVLIGIGGVLNLISYFTSLEDIASTFRYFLVGIFEFYWMPVYIGVGIYGILYVEINVDTTNVEDPERLELLHRKQRRRKDAEWFYKLQHNMSLCMMFVFIFQFFAESIYLEVSSPRWIVFFIFLIIGIFTAGAQDSVYRLIRKKQISGTIKLLVYYGSNVYYLLVYMIAALNPFSLTAAMLFAILEMIIFIYVVNNYVIERKLIKGVSNGIK